MIQSTPVLAGEPIAVIGSGCRFPGNASSPSKLWGLLSQPRDVLSKIPSTRFNPEGFYHPDGEYHGHSNVRHSYVLSEDHRAFDADFFNVSAAEASAIDPQQRLLLECVYEALEAGGQRMSGLKGSDTAVFVGLMCEEYSDMQLRDLNAMPKYFPTGTARSIVSNRISYFFDWRGPSMTIDTACSSSLVAVHQAVQAIRSGTSRVAIAAGTNLLLGPEAYIAESTFHMLSPQGRSQMWDARADGYARGDGVGAVLLKRLSDAIADRDDIECVIRETGVNQDGRTRGITVPSADAQVALVEDTYKRAGLDLSTPQGRPQFFEAHGTGTLAGDPIEAEAIHRAIGSRIDSVKVIESGIRQEKLFVGSIKSIIGHTEGTAGIAGLMKVSLALQHGVIPPNLLFETLNPAIQPFIQNLKVPTKAVEWPQLVPGEPRRASLNSFGFGGTNAHAIVESYEPALHLNHIADVNERPEHQPCLLPFTFSALTKSSLMRTLKDVIKFLDETPSVNLTDLAFTLSTRRSIFPYRAAYPGLSAQDLRQRIEASIAQPDGASTAITRASSNSAQILGIFTGQGAQWAGMGKELIQDSPFVQARLAYLEAVLATLPQADRPSWSLKAEILAVGSRSRLDTAALSQPICTVVQIILVDLLCAAGIKFAAVIGHSSGEIAAAYACGVLSARDAVLVAYYRGLHSSLAIGRAGQVGAMMVVGTSAKDAEELCALPEFEGRICVAACNSPTSVTLSGDDDAVEEAKTVFDAEGKFVRALRVDKAYHSHHMLPCAGAYVDSLRKASIKVGKPLDDCRWFSSVQQGKLMDCKNENEELDALYWCRNMTQTVLFSAAVEAAITHLGNKLTMALEVGPHGALRGPVEDTMKAAAKPIPSYGSCLVRNQNGAETLAAALGLIWRNSPEGVVDFEQFQKIVHPQQQSHSVLLKNLPTYQWDHERKFWHESRRSRALRTRPHPGHPLLGTLSPDSTELDIVWQNILHLSKLPWLTGHQLQGQIVFPAAGYVALALEAGLHLANQRSVKLIELENLSIVKAIAFEDENSGVETMFHLHIEQDAGEQNEETVVASFRFHSTARDADTATLIASGCIKLFLADAYAPSSSLASRETALSNMVDVDEDEFYSELSKLGYQYSGSFQALRSMTRKFGHGSGLVCKQSTANVHLSEQKLLVHPGFLDAAFQAIFLAYSWPGDGRLWSLHVPTSINHLRIDPVAFRSNLDPQLAFNSTVTSDGKVSGHVSICGDFDIYSADGSQSMIQVEGINIVPFAASSAAQDVQMFFDNVFGVASPDGELAVGGSRASAADIELGWVLERISYFYLRRLTLEITPEEGKKTEWHHQKLLAYASHIMDQVNSGKQQYAKKEWTSDTPEDLNQLMEAYADKIEVRLMRSVGENLAAAVRGETVILEHMLKDGMLNQYYVESLGLRPYTVFLTEIIAQITHRYPHMRILEIGAGTGGATKSIMRKISEAFDHYTFTDISPGFFETAQGAFSEYAGRMVFQVLDAEKEIVSQGYQEHSYDLVVASLVLHATKDLQFTLENVRKLLKPGGYLVMLEVTANDTMRMSFTMGGLSGWWLGADSGRPWSPCVSSAQWDALLLQSGFSGIETITPEMETLPHPFGVIVSRAVDERVSLLIEPTSEVSPLSQIGDLLIVMGTTLGTHRLAQSVTRMLKNHCSSIATVQTPEELSSMKSFSSKLTVLCLIELEQPIFQDMSAESFEALKTLFLHGQNVLWATRGCRQSEPYANMSVGFGRAIMMELSHIRLQFVDFDVNTKPSAQVLVDELLRLHIWNELENGAQDMLWSRESEVAIDGNGKMLVPRIKPNRRWNDCYNSSRREISAPINPSEEIVMIQQREKSSYSLSKHDSSTADITSDEEVVRLQVLYTAASALPISSGTALYPCIGLDLKAKIPVVALAGHIASIIEVQKQCVCPYHGPTDTSSADFLNAISAHIFSSFICTEAVLKTTLLLIEPDLGLMRNFKQKATQKMLDVTCITSAAVDVESDFVSINPLASSRVIKQYLPPNISEVIDFSSNKSGSHSLIERIKKCYPKSLKVVNASAFQPCDSYTGSVSNGATKVLKDAVESVSVVLDAETKLPSRSVIVSAAEFVKTPHAWSTVVDWTATDTVPVLLKPSDSVPLLRSDRTYLLAGLAGTGGLGLSLAEWMVGQGARHIVLTSRNPQVDPGWISAYKAQGVSIQVIANDITDRVSLQTLVTNIRLSWPPIAGVANGAMVLRDAALEQMTYDQMMRVLKPKVDGTRFLDELFSDDPLEFFILFSSLSCVFGNSGQSNYAAANMYMISLAAQRRQRGVAASVIDIGAIMGIGYMAREVSDHVLAQLVSAGYRKMSEHDFRLAFANAILAGRVGSGQSEELITGLHVAAPDEDLKPAWCKNSRFGHVIKSAASNAVHAMDKSAAAVSARELLKQAETQDLVEQTVRDAVLEKLKLILQLRFETANDPSFLLEQAADDLGIDSLVAVEIRSWFLREIEVDIPVLKILGGATIEEIVGYAVRRLPSELAQGVGEQSQPAATSNAATTSIGDSSQESSSSASTPQGSIFANPTSDDATDTSSSGLSSQIGLSKPPTRSPSQVTTSSLPAVKLQAIERIVPMSFGQSRFWFMSQLVADPTAFNVVCSMLVTGEVKVQDLASAVRDVGIRHEALRTCFFNNDNHQSMQGVLVESPLHLETFTVSSHEGIQEQFQELKGHVYDLSKGDTMRIILLSQSRTRHHLLFGYHHINMDGASLVVLVSDLQRLYVGEILSPPHLQYPEFSEQQLSRLRNGQWDNEISFWRKEFHDLPDTLPILNVSPDSSRLRKVLTTYRHLKSETRFSTQIVSQIRSLCRKLKVTPFHFYCAIFQVVLARLACTEDICIGVADANRTDRGAIESIGMFLNLFPVRLHTSLDQPFTSIIRQTKKKILSGLANSAVPFDVILNEVGVKRSPTHSPLFQAFIDYRHVNEKQPFGNAELEGQEYAIGETPYDVMVDIIDNPSGNASVAIMVQEGLYKKENADLVLQCYLNLVQAFADNCELPGGEPQMFNTVDVERALKMGQGVHLDLDDTTILDEIDSVASRQPDSVALKDGNGYLLSYRDMNLRSYAIAKAIAELNIAAHSRVAILQEPTADWICSMLGIWRAGGTYVPLELSQGTQRLATIVQDAQLTAILVHDETRPLVTKVGWNKPDAVINLSSIWKSAHVMIPSLRKPIAKDEAMVLYTSGSTGVPKGISLPHRMITNSIKGFLDRWPLQPQIMLQQIALSFDVSWWQALVALATKGTVFVAARAARKDPIALTKLIASEKITMTLAVPSEAASWLQYGDLTQLRNSSWVWHISAGEDFGFSLAKHLQMLGKPVLRTLNAYGPAETIIPHIYEVPYQNLDSTDMPVPIGKVMPNYTVYVVDEQDHPVPAGIPGQLIIGGAGVANGYINNPSSTAERFPIDTLAGPGAVGMGWTRAHRSGDRGYLRISDGLFIVQARIAGDTQVKLRGQRIELREIEANIVGASRGEIADAIVHMRRSENGDASSAFLVAHVILTPEAVSRYRTRSARDEFLRGLVAELLLPSYMRPSAIIALPSLPLNHHGKVDRREIAKMPLETAGAIPIGQSNGSSRAEETESQREMKEIWLSVLGEATQVHTVYAASDFFLVGGNSLLLISVQTEIRKRFGLTVPLVKLFQSSTLTQMAALLSTREDDTSKATDVDWPEETKFDHDLKLVQVPRSLLWPRDGAIVVLTGATGFLGRELLRRLTAMEKIKAIHCIAVRDPKKLTSITSSKVTIHTGDLTHPHLGLSEESIRQIFVNADAIIHNGADVSFLKSYASLRTANLQSTKELVRLALQYENVKHFHYVSTAGVAALAVRELYEEPLGAYPPNGSMDGYVISKWACESYLENVSSTTGLCITVHRPTAIVGLDAPRLDVMHNVLHFAEQLHSVPEMAALEGWFQFVGVEVVAQAMADDAVAGPRKGIGRVEYRNHCGNDDGTVGIHQLGEYLETKHGVKFVTQSDAEWIRRANGAGLALEVTEYLKSVSVGQRSGDKWVFPRIWPRE